MIRPMLLAVLLLAAQAVPAAPEFNPVRGHPASTVAPTRLIVALKPDANLRLQIADTRAREQAELDAARGRLQAIGNRNGLALRLSHSLTADTHVVLLPQATDADGLARTLAALAADRDVIYAVPDGRKHTHALPNDTIFQAGQWHLKAPVSTAYGTTTAAINAVTAWDTTTGAAGLVIAVIDTGILPKHPDLAGRLLAGYDFVGPDNGAGGSGGPNSTFLTANDGDGWDADPSDPGDWVSATDLTNPVFSGGSCTADSSSWHGTRVAGILSAATNNAYGIAGLTWTGKILPVRALGKCGGFDSDIIAGMRWAAGLSISGVPTNPTPAKVLNLSIGGAGACSAAYQAAVDAILAAGATIVSSAGNEGGPIDAPANCRGVIGVAGVRHVGTKVGYSNVSGTADGIAASVTLAAPAGNCVLTGANDPCLFSIDTLTNAGTTVPDTTINGYTVTDQFNTNVGTSFSSPIVAGIAALMYSVDSKMSPAQLTARLQAGTRAFPSIPNDGATPPNPIPACQIAKNTTDTSQNIECNCTTSTCGAGLADAAGAVAQALRPFAEVTITGSNSPGQTVTLSATSSYAADGHTIASETWSITAYTSYASPTLGATSGSSSSLDIPSCGVITVRLTVTDDAGRSDSIDSNFGQAPAAGTQCAAPVPPHSGGGGGGAMEPVTLAALMTVGGALLVGRRRRALSHRRR